ncbi:MAG: tol-pal system protein YbgF [Alphaproteobacteria bacterium]
MKIRIGMAVFAVILMTFAHSGGIGIATNAWAQDADLRALTDQLERLRKDLADIQKYVYRGGNMPALSSDSAVSSLDADPEAEARAARTQVRFSELEDQMRTLTGQIEEMSHGIDQVSLRLDKLIGDVDFRLSAIEKAQAEADGWKGQSSEIGSAIPAPTQPSPTQEALGAPPAPSEAGTLGTIPVTALEDQDTAAVEPAPAVPTTPALPPGTTKQQYEYAFSLLRQREFAEAERALTAFIEIHPNDKLTGNAYYWLAETHYVRKNFRQASGFFAKGYKNFPEGNKAPDSLLKLGMTLVNLDNVDNACFTFKELAERFPDASTSIKQRAATESQRAGCN